MKPNSLKANKAEADYNINIVVIYRNIMQQ